MNSDSENLPHILAESFCIIAQQSNSTDAPPLPKSWHFQAHVLLPHCLIWQKISLLCQKVWQG